jgi:tubby-related protein 1
VFELYLDGKNQQFLLSAKKRGSNKTSNYILSTDVKCPENDDSSRIAKLRSNFSGTEFIIYNRGMAPNKISKANEGLRSTHMRKEIGLCRYEQNVLGTKGPRKMKCYIPTVENGVSTTFQPANDAESMSRLIDNKEMTGIISLENKAPTWNAQVGAYVLNFYGRVTRASVKNFQLVDVEDPSRIILQFGRVEDEVFTMDVRWPMSIRQAFSICLSSFDYKFACE